MSGSQNYEIMILLSKKFNTNELKPWTLDFTKNLRKFDIYNISVISRGKRNLQYEINEQKEGHYIQINCSSQPKAINNLSKVLNTKLDILRFLILKKVSTKICIK